MVNKSVKITKSYKAKLAERCEGDLADLRSLLELQRFAFNEASKVYFAKRPTHYVQLHHLFYTKFRKQNPHVSSQVTIKAEQEVATCYAAARSNRHKITAPIQKKLLSCRFDQRLRLDSQYCIKLKTATGKKFFDYTLYPELKELLDHHPHGEPTVFERDGDLYISFPFEIEVQPEKPKLALGVDLGIRIAAACSDGRLVRDKGFNARKRRVRYQKRSLRAKSKGSQSAKRKLRTLRRKERNQSKNQTFLVANSILRTDAQVIALENLKGLKAKKKFRNRNSISQVPFHELRRVLTYKAQLLGKEVVVVNPAYTSQTDSVTGKREGGRRGRRFYAKNGLVYDADLNAARNIGQRANLPVSYGDILDGQGIVTSPIVVDGYRKPPNLFGGK